MSEEQVYKIEELDRLLNDPEICLQPALIWALAAEIAEAEPA
jgi:predicted ATPase